MPLSHLASALDYVPQRVVGALAVAGGVIAAAAPEMPAVNTAGVLMAAITTVGLIAKAYIEDRAAKEHREDCQSQLREVRGQVRELQSWKDSILDRYLPPRSEPPAPK